MNRRVFRGSRVNRDRREASFARSVIAEATRRHNEGEKPPPIIAVKGGPYVVRCHSWGGQSRSHDYLMSDGSVKAMTTDESIAWNQIACGPSVVAGPGINFDGASVAEVLADLKLRYGTDIEVCPDCFGTGEVVRHVSDDVVTEAICLECNGRGWIE